MYGDFPGLAMRDDIFPHPVLNLEFYNTPYPRPVFHRGGLC